MTEPVTLHHHYYLINTDAWLQQRTGAHDAQASNQVQDFTGCDVFNAYAPALDTAARMQLWCAAHGWPIAEGAPIEHHDACLSKPVTIVLAATTGNAVALISVDGGAPQVYADITTDEACWLASSTIQITCPGDHTWSFDGDRDLHAADGTEHHAAALFGRRTVISRCRDCAAFDDGEPQEGCPCSGYAVYCPTCGQRCQVTLPEIAVFEGPSR